MKPAVTRTALFVLLSLALVAPVRADHASAFDRPHARKDFKGWSKQIKNDRRWNEKEARIRRQYWEKMRRLREQEARMRRARWEKMRRWEERCDDRFPGRGIGRDSRGWLAPIAWNRDYDVRMDHARRGRDCDFRNVRDWPRPDRRDWPTTSRDRRGRLEDIVAERMGTRRRTDVRHDRWEQLERARRAEIIRRRAEIARRAEIIRARRQAACDYRNDRQHDGRAWITGWLNNDRYRNDRLNDILRERCNDRYPPRVVRRDTRGWPGQYPRHDLVGGDAAARSAAERARVILRTD